MSQSPAGSTPTSGRPGIDIVADILEGLPLESNSIDYAVSIHALPEIPYPTSRADTARSSGACCKPGGVLRLELPDLDKAIRAYSAATRDYFLIPDEDASTIGGKLVTQMIWYGWSRVAVHARLHRGAPAEGRLQPREPVRLHADRQRVPRDRRARQPRAGEPLHRGRSSRDAAVGASRAEMDALVDVLDVSLSNPADERLAGFRDRRANRWGQREQRSELRPRRQGLGRRPRLRGRASRCSTTAPAPADPAATNGPISPRLRTWTPPPFAGSMGP